MAMEAVFVQVNVDVLQLQLPSCPSDILDSIGEVSATRVLQTFRHSQPSTQARGHARNYIAPFVDSYVVPIRRVTRLTLLENDGRINCEAFPEER
jgi:hypothetical protein